MDCPSLESNSSKRNDDFLGVKYSCQWLVVGDKGESSPIQISVKLFHPINLVKRFLLHLRIASLAGRQGVRSESN